MFDPFIDEQIIVKFERHSDCQCVGIAHTWEMELKEEGVIIRSTKYFKTKEDAKISVNSILRRIGMKECV